VIQTRFNLAAQRKNPIRIILSHHLFGIAIITSEQKPITQREDSFQIVDTK
jgi:hypothetical protein